MSTAPEISKQYHCLKSKVEERIRQLEDKVDHSRTRFTSPLCHSRTNHSQYIHQSQYESAINHQHRHCCHNTSNFQTNSHGLRMTSRESLEDRSHNRIKQADFSKILMENMKAQQAINDNLKTLNERMMNLPVYSQQITEENSNRHSTMINHQRKIGRTRSASKILTKTYGAKNISSSRSSKAISRKNKSKISSDKLQTQFEYFPDNKGEDSRCPVHSSDQITSLYENRLKNKEIYRDSQHRNRKHQKDHLINSFKNQEKSRKQLLTKMAKNFFKEYGVK